jgi:hypothetical protein
MHKKLTFDLCDCPTHDHARDCAFMLSIFAALADTGAASVSAANHALLREIRERDLDRMRAQAERERWHLA